MRKLGCILAAWLLCVVPSLAQTIPPDTLRIASLTGYARAPFPNDSWNWGSLTLMPLLFEALTEVEEGGEIVPALATDWRAESENLWVFDLRRDVTFSNGEPFTAEAVQSAVEYLKSPEGKVFLTAAQVRNISRVEARDDFTVAFHTIEPDVMLPARLSVIYMLPPKYFEENGKVGFSQAPHGTASFMAVSLEPGRAEFVANPYAWRPPQVQKLVWLQVPDGVSRVQAILSDAVDIAFNVGPGAESVVAPAGARVDAAYTAGVDTMPFITVKADSPIADRRVRLAVNYAVNKARIAAALFEGGTEPATQFAPPGVFGFDPALPAPFPHDPDRARVLLAEAGYADGVDLTLELYVDSTDKASIVQQIQSDLAGAGIRLNILTSTVLDIQQRGLFGGEWEGDMMNLPYFGLPTFEALAVFNVHSCLWMAPFHCDEALTDRVLDARRTFDLDTRLSQTRELHQALLEDPPALLLFNSVRYFVVGKRVRNYRAPFGIIRFHELGLKTD